MRVFLAVDLADEVKKEVIKIQDNLKKSGADVKWEEPEKFHFTLKFIGEMDEREIKPLAEKLGKSLGGEKKFEVSLGEIGAFPDLRKMRVVWVGADRGAKNLKKIAEKAELAAASVGAAKDSRPFSAHLTLGRVCSPKRMEFLKKMIEQGNKPSQEAGQELGVKKTEINFTVEAVKIFQSVLKPTGSEYLVLKEICF